MKLTKINLLWVLMIYFPSLWAADIIYELPETQIAEEQKNAISHPSGLIKVAAPTSIENIDVHKGQATYGQWSQLNTEIWRWEMVFTSKNAINLNIGFSDVFLPHSAQLTIIGQDKLAEPIVFTDQDNAAHGFLWSGDVVGEQAKVVLTVSASEKQYVQFKIDHVARGFHDIQEQVFYNKSGSCNVDVACPEGEGWESEISSVGRYSFQTSNGGYLCTGQLIGNTAKDGTPYFLTADHCGFSDSNGQQVSISERESIAASMQIIWNYQSMTCRTPDSSQSGVQISTSGFNQRQNGATYIASHPFGDMALVRLNDVPNVSFDIGYSGWNRSGDNPERVVTIHHPRGHAKRISHEYDPPEISSNGGFSSPGNGSHWRINDWDSGTTEVGSSGAGLWDQNKLLIGQLHAGFAACGNNEADWYGRLSVSWDHGSDSQSRLKDWLDPLDTGQLTLQGSAGCDEPEVSIEVSGNLITGVPLELTAVAQGGAGGYTYLWDTNGDGVFDGHSADLEVTYNQAFMGNLLVKVTDQEGCATQTSRALVVQAPEVNVLDVEHTQSPLQQICGNGDHIIDPGERWRTELYFENQGTQMAFNTVAVLSKATSDLSDQYGNQTSSCASEFIDISESGQQVAWQASTSDYPGHDEGVTADIGLSQPVNFYGQSISKLRASSNGYLSPGDISGVDYNNDCPLPAVPSHDGGSARIAPMHADLLNSEFYYQSFSDCPRPSESGAQVCDVFMWQSADFYDTSSLESVDFQVILYPETGQWVYQYRGSDITGANSTTGIQNADASDGLTFACNKVDSLSESQAVCIFDKDYPDQSVEDNGLFLETPALDLGTLGAGESVSKEVIFAVNPEAACGKNIGLLHEASVYDQGFNPGTGHFLQTELGCNVVTHCQINNASDIMPKNGLWLNSYRPGNGTDFHFLPAEGRLVYVSYTGKPDGSPIWYITGSDESLEFNQYHNEILSISYDGAFQTVQGLVSVVGQSNTTVINETNLVQTRTINGQFSAEKMQWYQFDASPTINQYTGLWYAPNESGWGQSITTQGQTRGIVHYLYDQLGQPYWVIGWGANDDRPLDMYYTDSFCPSCPRIEPENTVVVGQSDLNIVDSQSGVIESIDINVPEYLRNNASWQKQNLPISNLTYRED